MAHAVSAFLSLYVFWLLLSGYFTPFLMIAGAGCAAAVVLFTRLSLIHISEPTRPY